MKFLRVNDSDILGWSVNEEQRFWQKAHRTDLDVWNYSILWRVINCPWCEEIVTIKKEFVTFILKVIENHNLDQSTPRNCKQRICPVLETRCATIPPANTRSFISKSDDSLHVFWQVAFRSFKPKLSLPLFFLNIVDNYISAWSDGAKSPAVILVALRIKLVVKSALQHGVPKRGAVSQRCYFIIVGLIFIWVNYSHLVGCTQPKCQIAYGGDYNPSKCICWHHHPALFVFHFLWLDRHLYFFNRDAMLLHFCNH